MCPRGAENRPFKGRINKILKQGYRPIITKIPTSTESFAFILEMGLIKIFGRRDLGTGTLHNLSNGGEGNSGRIKTTEEKIKVSIALKKHHATHKYVQSEDAIRKIKEAKRANPTGTGKWINNGQIQTKCSLQDLSDKLTSGWSLGTLKKHVTEEYKEKLRQKAILQWQRQKGLV